MTFNLNLTELAISLTTVNFTDVVFTILIVPVNPAFSGITIKYKKVADANWSLVNFPAPSANDLLTIPGLDMETQYEYYITAFDNTNDLSDVKEFATFTTQSTNVPNSDPVALKILENFVSILDAMQSSSLFATEFADVSLDRDGSFQVENYPSAIVSSVHTEENDHTAGFQTVFMDVMVDLHYETSENFETEARGLVADVKDAILADAQHGGLAVDTKMTTSDTYHAQTEGAPKGVAILMFTVQFRHVYGNSRLGRDC